MALEWVLFDMNGTVPDSGTAQACLVTAHDWDLLGAAFAGVRTAWLSRAERDPLGTVPEPDFRGGDLLEVAQALAAAQ